MEAILRQASVARGWTKPMSQITDKCGACDAKWVGDREECPLCKTNFKVEDKVNLEADQAIEDENNN